MVEEEDLHFDCLSNLPHVTLLRDEVGSCKDPKTETASNSLEQPCSTGHRRICRGSGW